MPSHPMIADCNCVDCRACRSEPVMPTIEELMDLLAGMTDWSEQTHSVEISYKSAQKYDDDGDFAGHDKNNRGFIVKTTLCGENDSSGRSMSVHAEGKTLPDALFELARMVSRTLDSLACRTSSRSQRVGREWQAFAERFK